MQVRLARIARTADFRQSFAAPYVIARLHTQTASMQMHVVRKLPVAQIQGDAVTEDRSEGYRHRWMECFELSRHVVGETIFHRDDGGIGDRANRFSVCV